eukprot:364111-Chlamydomonas_euryale.AAC.19
MLWYTCIAAFQHAFPACCRSLPACMPACFACLLPPPVCLQYYGKRVCMLTASPSPKSTDCSASPYRDACVCFSPGVPSELSTELGHTQPMHGLPIHPGI